MHWLMPPVFPDARGATRANSVQGLGPPPQRAQRWGAGSLNHIKKGIEVCEYRMLPLWHRRSRLLEPAQGLAGGLQFKQPSALPPAALQSAAAMCMRACCSTQAAGCHWLHYGCRSCRSSCTFSSTCGNMPYASSTSCRSSASRSLPGRPWLQAAGVVRRLSTRVEVKKGRSHPLWLPIQVWCMHPFCGPSSEAACKPHDSPHNCRPLPLHLYMYGCRKSPG